MKQASNDAERLKISAVSLLEAAETDQFSAINEAEKTFVKACHSHVYEFFLKKKQLLAHNA